MRKGKQYTEAEQLLMKVGVHYAEEVGLSRTKLAWALASIMDRQDSGIYSKMRDMSKGIPQTVWESMGIKTQEEPETELTEDMLVIKDDVLEQSVGEVVKVRVVAVKSFGALCTVVGATRTLLLHVSEIADEYIDDVSSYVAEGDEFMAMLVLSSTDSRLALSTKTLGTVRRKTTRVMNY